MEKLTKQEIYDHEKKERAKFAALKKPQYLVTEWIDEFDYDGMTCRFNVHGVFDEMYEANHYAKGSAEHARIVGLKEHASWKDMDPGDSRRPGFWDVNRSNKLVLGQMFKIGDGTGYNSIYNSFDVLEIDRHQKIEESMFMGDGKFPYEIQSCFDRLKEEQHFINSGKFMPYFQAQEERAGVSAELHRLEGLYGND